MRQWCGERKSLEDYKEGMKEHFASYKQLGLVPPKCIYVDDVEMSVGMRIRFSYLIAKKKTVLST